jgi:hypothetical protein
MDIGKLFQSIEDAVYEIMVWILLLPKTLLRSMFKPRWAIQYVHEELGRTPEDRFDEFLSPVLLWLIAAVLPLTIATVLKDGGIRTIDELIQALSNGLLPQALYAMITPFTYIVWMQWMNNQPIRKSTLKTSFYLHCYALAPAQFIYGMSAILTLWNNLFLLLLPAGAILLIVYEMFLFRSELRLSYQKALLYAIIPQFLLGPLLFWVMWVSW